MTWPPELGHQVLQACCINTPTSSAHLNARPCRCSLPPAGLPPGPPLPVCPTQLAVSSCGFPGLGLCCRSATCCPAISDQLSPGQTRGLFCHPVGCNYPFFKECGPCIGEAVLFQFILPRLLSLSPRYIIFYSCSLPKFNYSLQ